MKISFAILFALFSLLSGAARAELIEHGIVAPLSEGRGVIAHRTAQCEPIIITVAMDCHEAKTRNSLLIINAKTGKTDQYWHPDPAKVSRENYASTLASNGKFYTMWGDVFLEFDLEERRWTFQQQIEGRVMSFAENADGVLYFANFPESALYSFNPKTRALQLWGQLDEEQQYPFSLAAGKDGWIYAGIGTTKNNIVAFHPQKISNRENQRFAGNGDGGNCLCARSRLFCVRCRNSAVSASSKLCLPKITNHANCHKKSGDFQRARARQSSWESYGALVLYGFNFLLCRGSFELLAGDCL